MSIPSHWVAISGMVDNIILDLGDNGLTGGKASGLILKAIKRLNRRLKLTSANQFTFSPSGYITHVTSDVLEDLIYLQTECMAVKRGYSAAVSKGIRIRSGQDEVDTTSGFKGYSDFAKSVCDELADAIKDYIQDTYADDALLNAKGKLIWYGTQRRIERYDHDGDAYGTRRSQSPFDGDYNGSWEE